MGRLWEGVEEPMWSRDSTGAERGCGPLCWSPRPLGLLVPLLAWNHHTQSHTPFLSKAQPTLPRAGRAGHVNRVLGYPMAPSVLLLVVCWGPRGWVQEERRPPQAAEGQQVGAKRIEQVAREEAGPGVIRHPVGEGGAQVKGGTHV